MRYIYLTERKSIMLKPATAELITSDELLVETAEGIAVMELAANTFKSGLPLVTGIEEHSKQYMVRGTNKLFQVFDKLRAYGYEDRPCAVSTEDIYHAFAFVYGALPLTDFFGCTMPFGCVAALQAACARDKLHEHDTSRQSVIHGPGHPVEYWEDLPDGLAEGLTIHELSLLTGLEEQSVRNALSKDKTVTRAVGKHSKVLEIPPQEALAWMRGKGRFMEYEPPRSKAHISVPVAQDGSFFNATLKLKKGFAIGKKTEEHYYDTFEEALAALEKMPKPYWRRPSKTTGVPGIVRGVRWESRTRSELGLT